MSQMSEAAKKRMGVDILSDRIKTQNELLDEVEKAIEFACADDMWVSDGQFKERFEYKYAEWYQDKLKSVLEKIREARK